MFEKLLGESKCKIREERREEIRGDVREEVR
jgi:hypothetical protein